MNVEERQRIIIPTLAHQLLKSAANIVARDAGLGVVKGAVGIGKTFALERITEELADEGVEVIMITSSPEIEGNVALCWRLPGTGKGASPMPFCVLGLSLP